MLQEILTTLKNRQGESLNKTTGVGEIIELERILGLINQYPGINANELA